MTARIHALQGYSSVRFSELPGGLNTKPTLVWDILSPRGGSQRTRVTYQTGGVTWWADYNLIFNEGKDANSGVLDLSAWVSIINQSGAGYPDARLKLIAGDVHRAEPAPQPMMVRKQAMEAAMAADAAGFEQKAVLRVPPLHPRPPHRPARTTRPSRSSSSTRPGRFRRAASSCTTGSMPATSATAT